MIWRTAMLFLSYWVLSAHFLRYDQVVITGLVALLPLLIFFKKPLTTRLVQLGLVAGVIGVWLPTIYATAQGRIAAGEPWLRMALILVGVCVFSLLTAWVNRLAHQRK